MKDEYVVINKTNLLRKLEELEKLKPVDESHDLYIKTKIFTIEEILSQSIPLIPILEECFNSGEKRGYELPGLQMRGMDITKYAENPSKEYYINQLKLEI